MMETRTSPRPVPTNSLGVTPAHHRTASSHTGSSATPRSSRAPLPHSYLDAFHAPTEFPDASTSPGNTYTHHHPGPGQTVDFSPRAIPLSFHPSTSPQHAPTLTIRRSASATSFGISPPSSISPRTNYLQPVVPQQPPAAPPAAKDAEARITFRAPFSEGDDVDDVDAGAPPLASSGRRLSCEAATCAHHHHRQSLSSTISISCPRSPDEAGEVSASIAMTEVPGGMLVPLISRGEEMREMLEDERNAGWVQEVKWAVGEEGWDGLWRLLVEMERMRVGDREWLRRVRALLGEGKAWGEFCAMVGWDGGDWELEDAEREEEKMGMKKSASSGELTSIQEVEDGEGEKRG